MVVNILLTAGIDAHAVLTKLLLRGSALNKVMSQAAMQVHHQSVHDAAVAQRKKLLSRMQYYLASSRCLLFFLIQLGVLNLSSVNPNTVTLAVFIKRG